MPVVTVILPDTWDRDSVEVPGVKAWFVERIGQVVDVGIILEFPISVQELEAVGTLSMLYQIVPALRGRNVIRAFGHGSFMGNLQIFVSCRYNHMIPSRLLFAF